MQHAQIMQRRLLGLCDCDPTLSRGAFDNVGEADDDAIIGGRGGWGGGRR